MELELSVCDSWMSPNRLGDTAKAQYSIRQQRMRVDGESVKGCIVHHCELLDI